MSHHLITEEEYSRAAEFLAAHELEFYYNGETRDNENNYDWRKAMNAVVEFETAEQEKALEDFPPPVPEQPAKKGRSWIPPGGKLDSYYHDVKKALEMGDDAGLLELYYEAAGKRNEYARINYMRIYNLLTLKRESARS